MAAVNPWEIVGACAGAGMLGVTIGPRIEKMLGRAGLRTTATSTVAIYEENNKALREQNELRLAEIQQLTTQRENDRHLIDEQARRLDAQQEQIKTLRELVLQVKGIAEIKEQIAGAHGELLEAVGEVGRTVLDKLDESHGQLAGLISSSGRD